jgi:hypothetical protein
MKDNSFAYNNVAITFLDGYLNINNCSIEVLFPNITISDLLICTLCVVQLESAYVFRELCRQAAVLWRSKYSVNQIIKCEQADDGDNDSQIDISPVEYEQVSDVTDKYISNCGSKNDAENCEVPTYSNDQKKSYNHQIAKRYSCTECKNSYYISKAALVKHKNDKHTKKQDAAKFSCAHCVNKYRLKSSLCRHINIEHLKTRYSCKECPKTFKNSSGLYRHERVQHRRILYKCKKCPKTFKNSTCLNLHQKIIHLGVVFKCKECPKTYKNKSGLYYHKNSTHLGFLYKCKECPETFQNATGLYRHKKIIHLGLLYKCKECLKTFQYASSLYYHKKRTHPGVL